MGCAHTSGNVLPDKISPDSVVIIHEGEEMQNIVIAMLLAAALSQLNSLNAQSETESKPEVDNVEQIKLQRKASNQAIKNRDADTFVSFFDQDYIIMYGSSTKTLSLDAEIQSIQTLFSEFPDVNYVREPNEINISNVLPLAMEHGTWRGGQDTDTTYSGRYTAAWRKVEGTWKIHNELFVTLQCEGSNCNTD